MYSFDEVKNADPELAKAMEQETGRQNDHIELIASENFVGKAVMAAMGSTLTNKYAEGYPGKRYYGGCQYVDIVEDLARDRAKNCLAVLTQMFSHIPVPRQTWLYSLLWLNRARRLWE